MTFKVINKFKLPKRLILPESDKIYDLNKAIHKKLYSELILLTENNVEITNFISKDSEYDEGFLAIKKKNKWGFLWYFRDDHGNFKFKFIPINNYKKDKTRLVQTDEGYKDFTYFMRSQALPKAYKIGRAENPDKRLKSIQAHNSRDIVLDLIIADGRLESYFHNKFSHLRISDSREWFEMGDDLIEFIEKEVKKNNYILNQYLNNN